METKQRYKVRIIDNGRPLYLFAVNQRGAKCVIDNFRDAPALTESEIREYVSRAQLRDYTLTAVKGA